MALRLKVSQMKTKPHPGICIQKMRIQCSVMVQKTDSHYWRNMPYHQGAKRENKNSLLMSSSVAFGSDDWDDFVLETGEADITSMMLDDFQENKQMNVETKRNFPNFSSEIDIGFSGVGGPEQGETDRDISVSSNPVQGTDELAECIKTCSVTPINFPDFGEVEQGEDVKDIIVTNNQGRGVDESAECCKTCSVSNIFETEQDPLSQEAPLKKGLNLMDGGLESGYPFVSTHEFTPIDDSRVSESQELEKSKLKLGPLSDIAASQLCLASTQAPEDKMVNFFEDLYSCQSKVENNVKGTVKDSPVSVNLFEDHHPTPIKPMFCVSAVNPFLFSKVPALLHVAVVRRKIEVMLPYVCCPFRRSIYKGLGSRRYLLESNDFIALRDLIDLSKGAFAALPVMVETVSRKILEHITEQCLCCDMGVTCNAWLACYDPSSLIFPFQEEEIERCGSCELVFHKPCFIKITSCPCGAYLKQDEAKGSTKVSHGVGSEVDGTLDLLGRKPDSRSPVGSLSGLFSKARPEKLLGRKDSDTVILMGSLPRTSL